MTDGTDWLDHYHQLVPESLRDGLECMYIYICPEEFEFVVILEAL